VPQEAEKADVQRLLDEACPGTLPYRPGHYERVVECGKAMLGDVRVCACGGYVPAS